MKAEQGWHLLRKKGAGGATVDIRASVDWDQCRERWPDIGCQSPSKVTSVATQRIGPTGESEPKWNEEGICGGQGSVTQWVRISAAWSGCPHVRWPNMGGWSPLSVAGCLWREVTGHWGDGVHTQGEHGGRNSNVVTYRTIAQIRNILRQWEPDCLWLEKGIAIGK